MMELGIEELLKLMGENEKIRTNLRVKLSKGGRGIFNHLVRLLNTSYSSTVRRNAALILGEMGNRKAVNALIAALQDRVISVSSNAAIALGMLGDKRAVEPLIKRLNSSAWQVRLNAAISLGWIADRGATDSLFPLLQDRHAYVRRGAALALGQLGDQKLRNSLIRLLTDKNRPIYESAVVLAGLGDLSGYHHVDGLLPEPLSDRLGKKTRREAVKALRLGNLFYASGFYPAALSEYRRALSKREKLGREIYFIILNNLGNALRAVGQADHAVVFYMLALRLKPRDQALEENLQKAEALSDIHDLVGERIKRWNEKHQKEFEDVPKEIQKYFGSLTEGLDQTIAVKIQRHFDLGRKGFFALEAFRKDTVHLAKTQASFDFLNDHVPVCRSILLSEPGFHSFYLLLLKLSDLQIAAEDENANDDLLSALHEAFLCGYIVGMLQKIWSVSHLRFSFN